MSATVLVGPSLNWREALQRTRAFPAALPFAQSRIDFVAALSRRILLDAGMRQYPEAMAMADWFRKANLLKLRDEYSQSQGKAVNRARGLCFHVAPSNVDSIFLYSLLLSLLVGNSNIVRVSEKRGDQAQALLAALRLTISEHLDVQDRVLILSYGHDDAVTAEVSRVCNMRVIWGGDNTVQHIRRIELPARATELCFADRFSFALLNANGVCAMSDGELIHAADQFFNDAYWFDQQACSSPRLLIWIGDQSSVNAAQDLFWTAVRKTLHLRNHQLDASVGVAKLANAMEYAADAQVSSMNHSLLITRAQLASLGAFSRERHTGGGLFLEYQTVNLIDVARWASMKEQTVSTLGFTQSELQSFIDALDRGIDRVVPFGRALSFSPVWDGHDLLQAFSRKISVQFA